MSGRGFILPSPPFMGEREGSAPKGEALSVGGSAFPPTPTKIVIPAKAGIHFSTRLEADKWIPAFAGMTILFMPSGIGGASPA